MKLLARFVMLFAAWCFIEAQPVGPPAPTNHAVLNITIVKFISPSRISETFGGSRECVDLVEDHCNITLQTKAFVIYKNKRRTYRRAETTVIMNDFDPVVYRKASSKYHTFENWILKPNASSYAPMIVNYDVMYQGTVPLNITLFSGTHVVDFFLADLTGGWKSEVQTLILGNLEVFPFKQRFGIVVRHRLRCAKNYFSAPRSPGLCARFCKPTARFQLCDERGRLRCAENRFGWECAQECVPTRNPRDGYSSCSKTGDRICQVVNNDYNCSIPFCDDLWCRNGGSCRMVEAVPKCLCRPGFTGERCEKKIYCGSKLPNLLSPKRENSCKDTFSCSCFGFESDKACKKEDIKNKHGKRQYKTDWTNFIILVGFTFFIIVALPIAAYVLVIFGEMKGKMEDHIR